MPQTNSHGVGAPRHRTINVEVNLLSEWIDSRTRLRDERLRWNGILVTVALFSMILLPFLSNFAAKRQARAHKALRAAESQMEVVNRLNLRMSAVKPQIDGEATLQLCRGRSRLFLNQVLSVLNASTPRMAVDSIEANALGAEMTLRVKALAQDYASAQEFVAEAGKGSRVKSAIMASTRHSSQLAAQGVAFEFAKKVGVGP
jgi:hypothetical protein